MYVSIGTGRFVDEIRFSLLSADRFRSPDANWSIRVYADHPELYADLPADVRTVSAEQAAAWAGPHEYPYRGKIEALAATLSDPSVTRAAIVDGDTWFRKSPTRLFGRIAPGEAVVHVREGRPHPPEKAALRTVLATHTPVDRTGTSWDVRDTETMWNTGVVGLHRADAQWCAEALHLTDQFLDHGFKERSHTAEMVAVGVVLSRRSRLRECHDLVTHYWPGYIRVPFAERMRETWRTSSADARTGFAQLWEHRPRESLERQTKFWIKRLASKAGFEIGRRT